MTHGVRLKWLLCVRASPGPRQSTMRLCGLWCGPLQVGVPHDFAEFTHIHDFSVSLSLYALPGNICICVCCVACNFARVTINLAKLARSQEVRQVARRLYSTNNDVFEEAPMCLSRLYPLEHTEMCGKYINDPSA